MCALTLIGPTTPVAVAKFPGQGFLPDDRAWEMVTPPDKNGGDVVVDTTRIRVAATDQQLPMAAMFSSAASFGDVQGAGNVTDYVSQRTLLPGTPGWSTHNVFPLQEPLEAIVNGLGREGHYMGDVSADLTKAVFRATTALPGTPEGVIDTTNLYTRTDLRAAGNGSYRLLSGCTFSCSIEFSGFGAEVLLFGASTDFNRVLFSSENRLTDDSPGNGPYLYKAVDGVPYYVGYFPISPSTTCTGVAPDCEAEYVTPGERGGRNRTPHAISSDGTRVVMSDSSKGIFLRDDHGTVSVDDDTTTRINSSERSSPELPLEATYFDAAENGGRVFFASAQALTDDAPEIGEKLYRWSLVPDGEGFHLKLISVDQEPADPPGRVFGTLGVSSAGDRVYFLQEGQIVAGKPELDAGVGIYVWQQGEGVEYIGEVVDEADVRDDLGHQENGYREEDQLGARVTPDGLHLLISLRQSPLPNQFDHGDCPADGGTLIEGKRGCRQLYLYDAGPSPSLRCISCEPDGASPSSPAFFSVHSLTGTAVRTSHLNRAISDDGRHVFFSTGESLVDQDTNGTFDAYDFDSQSGEPRLLSSGEGKSPSYFVESSASGRDVFFATRDRLSEWDLDMNRDIYDARVGGGVPEPIYPKAPCRSDACRPLPKALGVLLPASEVRVKRGLAGGGRRRTCRKPGSRPHGKGSLQRRSRCAKAKGIHRHEARTVNR